MMHTKNLNRGRDAAKWEGCYSSLCGFTLWFGVLCSELVQHLGIISTHTVTAIAHYITCWLIILSIRLLLSLAFRLLVCPALSRPSLAYIHANKVHGLPFPCPNPAPSPSTTSPHHAEIPCPSLAPQNEILPQPSKLTVLYRKTLEKLTQSFPKQAPPSPSPSPAPPPSTSSPASCSLDIDASYFYVVLGTCKPASLHCINTWFHPQSSPLPLTFARATPQHLLSSLFPRCYSLQPVNPCIRWMFKYKKLINESSLLEQSSHDIFTALCGESGVALRHGRRHSLHGLDRWFFC